MSQRMKYKKDTIKSGNRASRRHPEKFSTIWIPKAFGRSEGNNAMRKGGIIKK